MRTELLELDSKKWRLICKLDGTTAFCYVHDVPDFQSELSYPGTYVKYICMEEMGRFEKNKKFCKNFYAKIHRMTLSL